MKTHVFRLGPGKDLRKSIQEYAHANHMKAASVLTCVGSVGTLVLRTADGRILKKKGNFEIVSLVGTLEAQDLHLHISASNGKGLVTGGHLREGTIVRTTAELVIAELDGVAFSREHDPETGYVELSIKETV
jgi:hypothetical protein